MYTINPGIDNTDAISENIRLFKPDRLVAAGGDGTVKTLAGMLVEHAIPLAIIPTGSANGMAAELGIPTNIEQALDLALTGMPQPMDLININEEWCIHLADIGWNATILKHFENGPTRGKLGYALALLKIIRKKIYMPAAIKVDGLALDRQVMMLVIANASRYGTGAVINPDSKVDDGLMELVIVRRMSFAELFNMMVRRKNFDPAAIEIISCKELEIKTLKPYHFQVDGEYLGKMKHIQAKIKKHAIEVVRA